MAFLDKAGEFFWSNGYAWGKVKIQQNGQRAIVELSVLHGELELNSFSLNNHPAQVFKKPMKVKAGENLQLTL